MKKIKLTQGKNALVSDIDFAYLDKWKWYANYYPKSNITYAKRCIRNGQHLKSLYMHCLILKRMGYKNFKKTDHNDGNGLNNQRKNLRPATNQQNRQNQRLRSDNTSGVKGVNWDKLSHKWKVSIQRDHKKFHLGYFTDKIKAAKAYNKAAKKYFRKFARLNKV